MENNGIRLARLGCGGGITRELMGGRVYGGGGV